MFLQGSAAIKHFGPNAIHGVVSNVNWTFLFGTRGSKSTWEKFHETLRKHLMAFDPSPTFWVRGRKNPGSYFKFDFRPNFKSTTAGRERPK